MKILFNVINTTMRYFRQRNRPVISEPIYHEKKSDDIMELDYDPCARDAYTNLWWLRIHRFAKIEQYITGDDRLHAYIAYDFIYIINLYLTSITDRGIDALQHYLPRSPYIEHLSFTGCHFSDVGACALSNTLKHTPSIKRLTLCECKFSEDGMLIFFENLPAFGIKELTIDNCDISDQAMHEFSSKLSQTFIDNIHFTRMHINLKKISALINSIPKTIITSFKFYQCVFEPNIHSDEIYKMTKNNICRLKAAEYFATIIKSNLLFNKISSSTTFYYNLKKENSKLASFLNITERLPPELQIEICAFAAGCWPSVPSDLMIEKCSIPK